MPLTILQLAFLDNSIGQDVSASAVLLAIFEPALVETTISKDEDAFAVRCLCAGEDLADVLALDAIKFDVWYD